MTTEEIMEQADAVASTMLLRSRETCYCLAVRKPCEMCDSYHQGAHDAMMFWLVQEEDGE